MVIRLVWCAPDPKILIIFFRQHCFDLFFAKMRHHIIKTKILTIEIEQTHLRHWDQTTCLPSYIISNRTVQWPLLPLRLFNSKPFYPSYWTIKKLIRLYLRRTKIFNKIDTEINQTLLKSGITTQNTYTTEVLKNSLPNFKKSDIAKPLPFPAMAVIIGQNAIVLGIKIDTLNVNSKNRDFSNAGRG